MSALTKESRERLFLSGRITAKHTPVKHKPSSPRRKTKVAATEGSYHHDAFEAFHNDALSRDQLDYLRRKATQRANTINKEVSKISLEAVLAHAPKASTKQGKRNSGEGTRSSAASGDSNSEDPADPDPERPRFAHQLAHQLYDQQSLADLFVLDKHTVQNIYSKSPWLLPVAISIPGARGPRWTPESVQEWLESRPQHTPKPAPQPTKRKVGRPRIALAGKRGAA